MADDLPKLRNDLNRGTNRGLEIRLGVIQVVALLGAVLGCMFGAFYLGFLSGRTVGFEVARSSSTTEVAKLPVPLLQQESDNETAEADPSRIYAKLHETARMGDTASAKPGDRVAAININPPEERDLDAQDMGRDLEASDSKSAREMNSVFDRDSLPDSTGRADAADVSAPSQPQVVQQPPVKEKEGASSANSEGKTLGMLLDERLEEARKTGDTKTGDTAAQKKNDQAPTPVSPTSTPKSQVTPTPKPQPTPQTAAKEVSDSSTTQTQGVKGVLPAGWYAQVAAPKKLPEAQQIAKSLKKAGFAVLIENAHVRGEDYYRVVVGPEDGRVQADRLVDQLKRESSLSAQPFVRRVR